MKNYILLFLIFLFKGTFLFSQEKIVVYQGNTVLYQTLVSDIEDIRLLNHSVVFNLEDNPLKIIHMASIDSIAFVKVYPLDVDITDCFSHQGGALVWKDIPRGIIHLFDSNDELLHFFDSDEGFLHCTVCHDFPVDFDNNSLLLVAGSSITTVEKMTVQLQQTSANEYQLNIDVTLGMGQAITYWVLSVLTPKIPRDADIKLEVNQHH